MEPTTWEIVEGISEITTPEHPNYGMRGSDNMIKEGVGAISPDRCLIGNSAHSIELCHCIQKKHEKCLDRLEWYWNMKRHSMNLDTHYNIFCAEATLHRSFENDKWLLLPEQHIIMKFYDSLNVSAIQYGGFYAKRDLFPRINEETFLYEFVHLQGLENEEISRLDDISIPKRSYHTHPFKTLPQLKSHLHPQFVIFDVGRKLEGLAEDTFVRLNEDFPSLSLIKCVYNAWSRDPPPDSKNDESYDVPGKSKGKRRKGKK